MPAFRPLAFVALVVSVQVARAQDPIVQSIIDAVSIDSLMHDLGLLTGEAPVDLGNGPEVIFSRNEAQPGNILAADWLQQRFDQMGFTPEVQIFSSGSGQNILAELPGAVHPERKVIICGHYDSMPGGPVASPAADDDGSGTVAVLEAMRVLSAHTFENSIIFALWDEEELGRLGSIHYANGVDTGEVDMVGVINMDAISWDGDGDGLMRVHAKNISNGVALKDSAMMVNGTYAGLQLNMAINLPGATYSDHSSFWNKGMSAILIIEDFDDDGNPHYHTSTDLVEYIDQPYFHGLARLSIGTAAVMARPVPEETGVVPTVGPALLKPAVFPNPTGGTTTIRVPAMTTAVGLDLYDAMGRHVLDLTAAHRVENQRVYELDAQILPVGTYTLRMTAEGRSISVPLVRIP